MLTPEFLDVLPDTLIKLYAQAERDILMDMARRIGAYDYWIPAAEHQKQMLKEMGAAEEYIYQRLSELTGKSTEELKALFLMAANETLTSDGEYYQAAGQEPETLDTSENLQKTLTAGMKQTQNAFKNLTRTTAKEATGAFVKVLDRAWMQISTGAFDYNTTIRSAVKTLAEKGIQTANYTSGKTTSVEAAVRRAVLTGINQTSLKMQDALADEMDSDLVEVTAHSGARPDHAKWQGGVYSRSGKSKKYPDFRKSTGYGTGSGLGGWNCRHNFFPFFEGSSRKYTEEQLKKLEEKDIEYNGQKMTRYEASQKQRYIERQIRRWKRENAAMQAAGLDTYESAAKIKKWQAIQKDFIKQTKLKRQYERERVPGFDHKTAKQVELDAEKYYTIWSKSIGSKDSVETLDAYYDMKYNKPEEYRWLKGYSRAVEKGDISPLVGFTQYKNTAEEIQEKLVGQTTANGITIEHFTTHFIDRVIGQAAGDYKGKRRGVMVEDALSALKFPIQIGLEQERSDGKRSIKFTGETCEITVNPESQTLVQVNPKKGR